MILLIDNNDSFTYNVLQLLIEITNHRVIVLKSSMIDIDNVEQFEHIIFSPGPGVPDDFPIMRKVLETYDSHKAILGICLGHQAICQYYGGRLRNMDKVAHGVASELRCDPQSRLFRGVESILVGRYHSWVAEDVPDVLKVTATDFRQEVMAVEHIEKRVYGIQFHPESYITQGGQTILSNFLDGIS